MSWTGMVLIVNFYGLQANRAPRIFNRAWPYRQTGHPGSSIRHGPTDTWKWSSSTPEFDSSSWACSALSVISIASTRSLSCSRATLQSAIGKVQSCVTWVWHMRRVDCSSSASTTGLGNCQRACAAAHTSSEGSCGFGRALVASFSTCMDWQTLPLATDCCHAGQKLHVSRLEGLQCAV